MNIGQCLAPSKDPAENADDTDEADSGETPTETVIPTGELHADPGLAGGKTEVITITGFVDDEHLTNYTVKVGNTVIQQASDLTDTRVEFMIPWNVVSPQKEASGTYIVTLDANDASGNAFHAELVVEVDNDGPVVTVAGGDTIIKSGSISPEVEAADPRGTVSFDWLADETNPGAVAEFDTSAARPVFSPSIEGSYVFHVEVTDGLGNVSSRSFAFGYAKELATVPLLIVDDPADKLITQNPSTPTKGVTNKKLVVRAGTGDDDSSDSAAVLGNTIASTKPIVASPVGAAIAPTGKGWSIFGVLWYWWVIVIGASFIAWRVLKSVTIRRVSEDS